MTTPWPPRRSTRRPLAPALAAPREPVDLARIGRRVVRRRAKGMDAGAVAAPSRARGSTRGRTPGTRTWPTTCAARRSSRSGSASISCSPPRRRVPSTTRTPTASSAPNSRPKPWPPPPERPELREAARVAARADELQALRALGTLEQTEPRTGDEAARDELTRRAGGYVPADVDAWLAHALAAHRGHYRDPPPARKPPAFSPRRSSRTPRCSPNSPAWSPAPRRRSGVRGPARHR